MFIEPSYNKNRGWIEIVCGPMFSGKSEELIRRIKRAQIANLKVEIFKPKIDTRYNETHIVSHNQNRIPSTPIDSSQEILLLAQNVDVIGIDEAQFFDTGIVHVVEELANKGARVIVAGLDLDYLGEPFGPMPNLLSKAEYITKLHAICMDCGDLASRSFRYLEQDGQVLIGEKNSYEPLCRSCFNKKMAAQKLNKKSAS